jgi:putative ABC transport system permease protein
MIAVGSTVKISLRALNVNKMRSALTTLGVIIGVGAVISMLAVGTGASQRISEQMASIGSNLLIIVPGSTTAGGLRMGAGTEPTLTMADTEAIRNECPAVETAAPIINGTAQFVYGNQNWSTIVTGTTSDYLAIRDWGYRGIRAFSEQDITSAAKVCLLGNTVANKLFGAEDPVGAVIRIQKVPFRVLGVLDEKGQNPMGQDQDDTVLVPITTAQKKLVKSLMPGMVRIILVQAYTLDELPTAEKQITSLLNQRHRIPSGQENDFSVRNLTQMMNAAQESVKIMSLLLGIIGSISLLVGGIGIMNIMLVSVTERTREIGIRMAVGAKTWDIRLQFLAEALTLSMIGGLAGIILGVGGAKAVAAWSGWPTLVSPFSILLAFSFSVFVGLFFGMYPAYKASLLNPIEALRYE